MKKAFLRQRRIAPWLVAAACLLLAAVIVSDLTRPPAETETANAFLMGTITEVQLAGSPEDTQAVLDAVRTAENETLSRRRPGSELERINQHTETELSPDLAQWLGQLEELGCASNGAFSILLGRVSDLWNFDAEPTLPSPSDLADALDALAQGGLTIEQGKATLSDGLLLDLGAAGKGIACDIANDVLISRGVSSGVVSVGGSLLLLGPKERTIAIRDPFGEANEVFATLRLSDCFVSTSGNYEKFFDRDGVRYHHSLDPATGTPADAGRCSVTVVCGEGILSDALSTACFVLGIEASRPLLERYDAEAVFITSDGQSVVTDGLRDAFTPQTSSSRS